MSGGVNAAAVSERIKHKLTRVIMMVGSGVAMERTAREQQRSGGRERERKASGGGTYIQTGRHPSLVSGDGKVRGRNRMLRGEGDHHRTRVSHGTDLVGRYSPAQQTTATTSSVSTHWKIRGLPRPESRTRNQADVRSCRCYRSRKQ